MKSMGRFGFGGATVLVACRGDQVSCNTTVGAWGCFYFASCAKEVIGKKCRMPNQDWKAALNRFSIEFEDRVPRQ